MVPQVFGLIRDLFPPHEMGKAWARLRPDRRPVGDARPGRRRRLIDADLLGTGWRMIFLVNVPVAAYVLIVGGKLLPGQTHEPASQRLDVGGVALAGSGSFLLVYPLVQGRELGWPAWTIAMLVAARGRARRLSSAPGAAASAPAATPLIETSLFPNRSYVSGVVFALVFLGAMAGIALTLNVALQAGLGYTPIHAGLTSAPFAVGGFVGSAVGGAATQKLGRTVLHAGLVVMAAGLVVLASSSATSGPRRQLGLRRGRCWSAAIGMGMVFVPLFDIVVGGVARPRGRHGLGPPAGDAAARIGARRRRSSGRRSSAPWAASPPGRDFLNAAELTTLVSIGMLAVAFAIGFLLPKRAKGHEASPAEPVLA